MVPAEPSSRAGHGGPSTTDGVGLVPPDFLFGVATAGFQVEGGYNGPGQPANNWADWERAGRVEPAGSALDFWSSYEEHLDRVVALGCDSFRMSVEWARVETADGVFDRGALDHYGAILDACRQRGITPLVTLHHFTHPRWLGPDLWLRPDAPWRFATWAGRVVESLGDRCRHWVTLNEPNVLAIEAYLLGSLPPGRRGDLQSTVRALDNLMTAHVLGYQQVHRAQPDAVVGTNTYALSLYELDRLPVDLLIAPSSGVDAASLGPWLENRRSTFRAGIGEPSSATTRVAERLLAALSTRLVPLERAFPRTVSAVEQAGAERLVDVVQVDYYSPVAAEHLRLPGRRTAGGRHWEPTVPLWDDPPSPAGLVNYCVAAQVPGLPLWVVENGMCNRAGAGRRFPREDGWDRPRYLRAHLAAVVELLGAGVAVGGYWHWTLADNYEWGSYEPRFGLFGVDRADPSRWSELDSMGRDAAGAYRHLIEALRGGERDALEASP